MEQRLAILEERVTNLKDQNTLDHSEMMTAVKNIDQKLDKHFVSKSEFVPVRNIVFGMVGAILLAVLSSLLAQVIKAF